MDGFHSICTEVFTTALTLALSTVDANVLAMLKDFGYQLVMRTHLILNVLRLMKTCNASLPSDELSRFARGKMQFFLRVSSLFFFYMSFGLFLGVVIALRI